MSGYDKVKEKELKEKIKYAKLWACQIIKNPLLDQESLEELKALINLEISKKNLVKSKMEEILKDNPNIILGKPMDLSKAQKIRDMGPKYGDLPQKKCPTCGYAGFRIKINGKDY